MMEFDRHKQRLCLEGKIYTPEEIYQLVGEGRGDLSSAQTDLFLFLAKWFDDSPFIIVHTSGSTGEPKELSVCKDRMMQSARLTCEYLDLQKGETALLCMNLRYIGAMMVIVRSLVAGLNLIVRPASGHPLVDVEEQLQFVAMVPLQVYNTLQVPEEKERLMRVGNLIIGGGAVDEALVSALNALPGAVYSTYGMTETLSHIALRRLNGESASDHYHPFSSVNLSLSPENTLVIEAPLVCEEVLQTNDVARIYPDGSFTILGRADNVINTGGIKVQAEELEKRIHSIIDAPLVVTSIADERLGQAVTLLLGKQVDLVMLEQELSRILSPYECPKHICVVDAIPQVGNGKVDRMQCRVLAERLLLDREK